MSVINGAPAHVLFVHIVIVLVPLAALALVVCAAWPAAARRFGLLLPVLALSTVIVAPVAAEAGKWLHDHVEETALVRRHVEYGEEGLFPWLIGLFLMSGAVWWISRRTAARSGESTSRGWATGMPMRIAVIALSLTMAVGALVDVYRIGSSGAEAAWDGKYSSTTVHHSDQE